MFKKLSTVLPMILIFSRVLANGISQSFDLDVKAYGLSRVIIGCNVCFAKFPDNSYQLLDQHLQVKYGPNVEYRFGGANHPGILLGERLWNVAHIYQRVQGVIHEFHPYVYVVQFVDGSCQFYNLGLPLGTRLMDVAEVKAAFNGFYITFNRPQADGKQQRFFNMHGIEMETEISKYDDQVQTRDLLNLDKLADIQQVQLIDTDFAKGYRAILPSGFFIIAYVNQAGEYVCSEGNIYTDKITVLKPAKEYFEILKAGYELESAKKINSL